MNRITSYISLKRAHWLPIFFACLLITGPIHAQSWLTDMLQQIAKLELYIQEAEKGYQEVSQGLNTIGQIKQGDLDLHTSFFNSLAQINPAVANDVKVADILAMQTQMLSDYNTYQNGSHTSHFNTNQLSYISTVYSSLINKMSTDLDELTAVLTAGNVEMSDAQRINSIDRLYARVSEKYAFMHSFTNRVQLEFQQQQISLQDIQNLQKLVSP